MSLLEVPTQIARGKSQPHSMEGWERGQGGIDYCSSRENVQQRGVLFQ